MPPPPMPSRPRVFIGSSAEGLSTAKAVQRALDHACQVRLWSQGIFETGGVGLQSLLDATENFDFAVFIVDIADTIKTRKKTKNTARDNVIFELGLFLGAIGKERCYIVYDRTKKPDLPSDLNGVNPATYELHDDGDLDSSLGAASSTIEERIKAVKAKLAAATGTMPSAVTASSLSSQGGVQSSAQRRNQALSETYLKKVWNEIEDIVSERQFYRHLSMEPRPPSPRTPSEVTLIRHDGNKVYVDISKEWLDFDDETILNSLRMRVQMLTPASGGKLGGYIFVSEKIPADFLASYGAEIGEDVRNKIILVETGTEINLKGLRSAIQQFGLVRL